MKKTIDGIMTEFTEFSIATFTEADALTSLKKLRGEIKELEKAITDDTIRSFDVVEEYADCIMCLFDSAKRFGFDTESIRCALSRKLIINKNRKWVKNPDNTYSHVKELI